MTLCLCFDIFCTELKTFLQQFFVCQYDRKAPHLGWIWMYAPPWCYKWDWNGYLRAIHMAWHSWWWTSPSRFRSNPGSGWEVWRRWSWKSGLGTLQGRRWSLSAILGCLFLKCKHCKGVPAALGVRSQKMYFATTVFVLLTIGRRLLRLHFLLASLTLSQPGIAEQTQQLAQ